MKEMKEYGLKQWSSNFNVYQSQLRLLDKMQSAGPHHQEFWFSMSRVGPENLYFSKYPDDADAIGPYFEKHWPRD